MLGKVFVPISARQYVNLMRAESIELGVDPETGEVQTGDKLALIIWIDKRPFLAKKMFAQAILALIGGAVHLVAPHN